MSVTPRVDHGHGKTIAVMQPYFFPYAGYFRLLSHVDEFVIYDCVQHPRRGRVHRTEVPGPSGDPTWLTLPLASQPRDTLIADLEFAVDARDTFDRRLRRHTWIEAASGPAADAIREHLRRDLDNVVDYLEAGLALCSRLLGIDARISRSSGLAIDPSLHGQERILAIAAALGATDYLNAPGGRHLYDPERFRETGIDLQFLPPYGGPHRYLLHALLTLDPADIVCI